MYLTANGSPCDVEPASPVLYHSAPVWLAERAFREFGPAMGVKRPSYHTLTFHADDQTRNSERWRDHDGSTLIDGTAVYVSENYWSTSYPFPEVEEFARRLDCTLVFSGESCWLPGKTIRMSFVPNPGRFPSGDRLVIDLDGERQELSNSTQYRNEWQEKRARETLRAYASEGKEQANEARSAL